MTNDFIPYRRTQIAEMRPFILGENLDDLNVSISSVDLEAGSPSCRASYIDHREG